MSHRHFCDFAGHYWPCEGSAVRLFAGDSEPSVCMCLIHQVPMEQGDHTECPIELLACPEHRADQMRAMGHEPEYTYGETRDETEQPSMFMDREGNPTAGFCLWCGRDFYSMAEVEAHNADNMADCPIHQQLKGEQCLPPVLQAMFEQADFFDDEGTDNQK
jgi:hypothetical protein